MNKRDILIELIKKDRAMLISSPEEFSDKILKLFDSSPKVTFAEAVNYILDQQLMEAKTVAQISETAEMFINYYGSVGWVVGKQKTPMKSWRKALNNWCKRDWNKNSQAKAKVQETIKAYMLIQQQKN